MTRTANLRSKGQRSKVKVTENENAKIVFCSCLHQQGIDLRQSTNTKMISRPMLLISSKWSNTFHQLKCLVFVIFVCKYPPGRCIYLFTYSLTSLHYKRWSYAVNVCCRMRQLLWSRDTSGESTEWISGEHIDRRRLACTCRQLVGSTCRPDVLLSSATD